MIERMHQQMFMEENMSNLTSAASGDASGSSGNNRGQPSSSIYPHQQYFPQQNQPQDNHDQQPHQPTAKKKRSLPGNPDPDAEVIALSPKSLLATNRFVCEICNKGFQRDQNLQLHRRGHNLPWKLKQKTSKEVRKKVYVCPEPTCVHHDPSRALGDLTGIKKHFCRKHGEKKWKCDKCSKRYAVQSDWKAHSKVCGTREYRCDCGTLFSRRDSFITHRAFCDALAEETARAITTNSLLSNPVAVAGPSAVASHFINSLQQQQAQLINSQHDPLHSFPLKREQQNLINLPPWLACPPSLVGLSPTSAIDHHHQNQNQNAHLSSPSSSSSIFHQDHHHHQLMQQQQDPPPHHQQLNSNPSNPNIGPSPRSFPSMVSGAFRSQGPPQMSATALLQKAAQMGATMSKTAGSTSQPHHHQQAQLSDTNSNTTTPTTTAGLFGLNLSSRDHHQELMASSTGLIVNHGLSPFGSKAATTTTTTTTTTIAATTAAAPTGGSDQLTGPSPPSSSSSSFLHDMMINSLSSSTYDHHDNAFVIGGMGMLSSSKKDAGPLAAFHQTAGGRGRDHSDGGGGGRNDGLTRDFLGLRPLSHNEILTIAGLGNRMTSNSTPSHDHHHHHQDSHNKPWQG